MLKVHFVSLGCPKNRVDTEVMLGKSSGAGYTTVAELAEADVIVVNTCGFIEAAKRESVDVILEMARNKTEGRCRRLVVTGCLAQRYAGELAEEMPEVDAFVGTGDPAGVVEAIAGRGERIRVAEVPCYRERDAADRAVHLAGHTAYLKIAEGCDRRCAFCIIPQLRGAQASRRSADLLDEARRLAAAGARELCLVAQDLTAYGRDANGPAAARRRKRGPLARLVRKLAGVDELRWLRLHYAYPTGVDDELLAVMAGEERVAKYLDVPLQHVDDGVLRAMRRGHGGAAARRLIERLRRCCRDRGRRRRCSNAGVRATARSTA
jgi:ribosomal protein S12 methylthiotransferase